MAEVTRKTPRVVVLGMGGTIAMAAGEEGGAVPALRAAQLMAAVPGLAETGIEVEVEDVRQLPGAALAAEDVAALATTIERRLADGVDGVVVSQGTDTIEESAYLLDLLHTAAQPVVVTGAMRLPGQAGADGPANLLAAVQVAAAPQARERGVLVVLAEQIHAARYVRKTHTTSTTAFRSPDAGPVGYVVEGEPRLLAEPQPRTVVPHPGRGPWPPVALVTLTMGEDGHLLDELAERVRGVVIAAMGAGHAPKRIVSTLEELARRVPVVLASRTGAGSVLSTTYGFAGSEQDLLRRGLTRAGFLDPLKARVLLQALLAVGSDRDTIAAAFAAAGEHHPTQPWPFPPPPAAPRE
ncbi:asparaginase [Salinactinospora qingdaonensis]|uniref:Asparaginase n=1 Tax=Salinactinospora qingdaonensis TaxID=702744 RepID=A0ABP7FWF2_9ACTN